MKTSKAFASINKKIFIYFFIVLTIFSGGLFSLLVNQKNVVEAEQLEILPPTVSASASDSYYCLTDEHLFLTEDQNEMGLCWNYASNAAFASNLSLQTNQYYHFSKAWVAVCNKKINSSYKIGDGGSHFDFESVAKTYGLVFEEDMPSELVHYIDDTNYEAMFDYYKKYAQTNYNTSSIKSELPLTGNTQTFKNLILQKGALNISYYAESMKKVSGKPFEYANSNNLPNHSITLIGWDNNISFQDQNGITQTGCYICLNSWGSNKDDYSSSEIVYIPYSCAFINAAKVSIYYDNQNDYLTYNLSQSNSNVLNDDVNRYKNGWNATTGVYKEGNIFNYGQNIDMQYSFDVSNSSYNVLVDILLNNVSVKDKFSKISVDKNNKKIDIETNTAIDSGTYKIVFGVDKNNDGVADNSYYNQLFVFSGADFTIVNGGNYSGRTEPFAVFNQNELNSAKEINNISYVGTMTNRGLFFNMGNLATVVDAEIEGNGINCNPNIYKDEFVSATNSSYSRGKIQVVPFMGSSAYLKATFVIKFITLDGNEIKFKINYYRGTDTINTQPVLVFYETNGGVLPEHNYEYFALGNIFPYAELPIPQKDGSVFKNWCLNSSLTSKLEKNNGVSRLKTNNCQSNDASNHNAQPENPRKYVILYAEWEQNELEFLGQDFGKVQYGDSVNFEINPAKYGSNNYDYTINANTLPQGLIFNKNTRKITGIAEKIGNYNIEITAIDLSTSDSITQTFKIVVEKRKITFTIDNKTSGKGEPIKQLTGSITSGSVYNNENLNIVLECDIDEYSNPDEYEISGTWNNSNYVVTFINGTYLLTLPQINASVENYNGIYDGQNHSISVSVLNQNLNCQIQYSLDNFEFSNDVIYQKDYTETPIMVYVKIIATNYEDFKTSATIQISKKVISLIWENTILTYNQSKQKPNVSCEEICEGDIVDFLIVGEQKNSGKNYVATASINSENYAIANYETTFEIKKAKVNHSQETEITFDNGIIATANTLEDLLLPQGYSWNNPNQVISEGENICYLTYTPLDTENYETETNVKYILVKRSNVQGLGKIILYAAIGGVALSLIITMFVAIKNKKKERELIGYQKAQKIEKASGDKVMINFITNAPIHLSPSLSSKRMSINLPRLERSQYVFVGWYTDKLLLTPYENNGTNNVLVLYAKWLPKI